MVESDRSHLDKLDYKKDFGCIGGFSTADAIDTAVNAEKYGFRQNSPALNRRNFVANALSDDQGPAKGQNQAARALISGLICRGRCNSMARFAAASISVFELMIFSSMLRWLRRL